MRIHFGRLMNHRFVRPHLSNEGHAVLATGLLSGSLRLLFANQQGVLLAAAAAIGATESAMLDINSIVHVFTWTITTIAMLFGMGRRRWVAVGAALASAAAMIVTAVTPAWWLFLIAYMLAGCLVPSHHVLGDMAGRQFTGHEGRFEARRSALASWIGGAGAVVVGLVLFTSWAGVHVMLFAPVLIATAASLVGWRGTAAPEPVRSPGAAARDAWQLVRHLVRLLRGIDAPSASDRELLSFARALGVNCMAQFSLTLASSAVALFLYHHGWDAITLFVTGIVMAASNVALPAAGRAADRNRLTHAAALGALALVLAAGIMWLSEQLAPPVVVQAGLLIVAYFVTAASGAVLTMLVRTRLNKHRTESHGVLAVASAGWLASSAGAVLASALHERPGQMGVPILIACFVATVWFLLGSIGGGD